MWRTGVWISRERFGVVVIVGEEGGLLPRHSFHGVHAGVFDFGVGGETSLMYESSLFLMDSEREDAAAMSSKPLVLMSLAWYVQGSHSLLIPGDIGIPRSEMGIPVEERCKY